MKEKWNNIMVVLLMSSIVLGFSIWFPVKPRDRFSYSERRTLAQFPELSLDTVFRKKGDDSFMRQFETYAADQFPLREVFRRGNSLFQRNLLGRKEIHGIYIEEGHASKVSHGINREQVQRWLSKFAQIHDRFLRDSNVYFAVIPDKNEYLAFKHGYPVLNYEKFVDMCVEGTKDYARYIELRQVLSIENYYDTDIHWKQETLLDAADYLAENMGRNLRQEALGAGNYHIHELDVPFYGVYYGQAALPLEPDRIRYVTGQATDGLKAVCYDNDPRGEEIPLYDMEKACGRDPYEMFLGGAKSLITIENPGVKTQKELVLFRDSFGSSLAPLLAGCYSKITLVDLRYISPQALGEFVDFAGADVLFLYSVQVLNET